MKKILSNLQRFHIETIMYLIVIIVALVLLYLFMNNKINFFESFQTEIDGCEILSNDYKKSSQFTLIYYHDDECIKSKEFKSKVWDKLFIESIIDNLSIRNEFINQLNKVLDNTDILSDTMADLNKVNNSFYNEKISKYKDIPNTDYLKQIIKNEVESIFINFIDNNKTKINCKSKNEKFKCDNPPLYIYNKVETTSSVSSIVETSLEDPDINYVDRGYYYIHPFFERWFKDIFIIKKNKDKYEIEFIKCLSQTESVINRFALGSTTPDMTPNEEKNFVNTLRTNKTEEYYSPLSISSANNAWGNKIGEGINHQDLITNYINNILKDKLKMTHSPAIILEDSESSDNLDDNIVLSDSIENNQIKKDTIYNLRLLGINPNEDGEAEALENIFYYQVIKFIDNRKQIFNKLECETPIIKNPIYKVYIYYSDNCEECYNCLTELHSNKNNLSNFKNNIQFVKVSKSGCSNANYVLCMDKKPNLNNIEEKDSFFKYSEIHDSMINNVNNVIDHNVNYEFIKNYDEYNLKLPYIILYSHYKTYKDTEVLEWSKVNNIINDINVFYNKQSEIIKAIKEKE